MPNYSVKMGFGLHVGWAIEGAIGSDFKIDVSYLSPNVKLSDELEASTKMFGTSLIFSGFVYDLISPEVKQKCRQIDTVRISGARGKFRLYTCDIDYNLVEVEPANRKILDLQQKKIKRVKARLKRDRDKVQIFDGTIKLINKFELDADLAKMRTPFTDRFYEAFNDGLHDYLAGRWESARRKLEAVEAVRGSPDGPSLSILRVMEEHHFKAPPDWEGWRELD